MRILYAHFDQHVLKHHIRERAETAAALLWPRIRNRHVQGARFERRARIGPFVADFLCQEAKLVIEVDRYVDNHPMSADYERARLRVLNRRGLHVIRFSCRDVLFHPDAVLARVSAALADRMPSN